jgi:uncharacterized membrane protein YgaE (UPF0421/DUF939 family)
VPLDRWRRAARLILQAALAAGLAWLIASQVAAVTSPFYAPIAAVVCLGVAPGQRVRRGIELMAGIGIGVVVGDALVSMAGTGVWQIALIVALAMSAATLLDGGTVITIQAAVSAVVVATLYAPVHSSAGSRLLDGAIGGAVGLAVAALLPADPLAATRAAAERVLGEIARAARGVGQAIATASPEPASVVVGRLRDGQALIDELRAALRAGDEIVTIAPWWRRRRPALVPYATLVGPVECALSELRVLAQRAAAALRAGATLPEPLAVALLDLAAAADGLGGELSDGVEPAGARRRLERLARAAGPDLLGSGGFSARVLLVQLRSTVVDLLQAAGTGGDEAIALLPPLDRPAAATGPRQVSSATPPM